MNEINKDVSLSTESNWHEQYNDLLANKSDKLTIQRLQDSKAYEEQILLFQKNRPNSLSLVQREQKIYRNYQTIRALQQEDVLKKHFVLNTSICLIESEWQWAVEYPSLERNKSLFQLKAIYNVSMEASYFVTYLKCDVLRSTIQETNLDSVLIAIISLFQTQQAVQQAIDEFIILSMDPGQAVNSLQIEALFLNAIYELCYLGILDTIDP